MGRKVIKPATIESLLALEYGSEKMGIPPRPIVHLTMTEYVESGLFADKVEQAKKAILGVWK